MSNSCHTRVSRGGDESSRPAPKTPREAYRAKWGDGFSDSRKLIQRGSRHVLRIWLFIETEPNLPIKELYGIVRFVKDGQEVYRADVAHRPDVSFSKLCLPDLNIDPYDDTNPTHRTLRYAKDKELVPVFTVSKVVLADGTVKTFE